MRLQIATMKLQKETDERNSSERPADRGPHGRWYADACGTAFGLEILGERWSLLIVRELMFGPRRFSDLRSALPGISAKVLTERLAGLEANGVLLRETAPEPAPVQLYGLTRWGYDAEPIIQELGRWAAASPLHDPTLPLSPVSFMLLLRTMLDHRAARDMQLVVAFTIGTAQFTATLAGGEMPVERGLPGAADLRFDAPGGPSLAAVFYGGVRPEEVGVTIHGDAARIAAFTGLFTLPPKASQI